MLCLPHGLARCRSARSCGGLLSARRRGLITTVRRLPHPALKNNSRSESAAASGWGRGPDGELGYRGPFPGWVGSCAGPSPKSALGQAPTPTWRVLGVRGGSSCPRVSGGVPQPSAWADESSRWHPGSLHSQVSPKSPKPDSSGWCLLTAFEESIGSMELASSEASEFNAGLLYLALRARREARGPCRDSPQPHASASTASPPEIFPAPHSTCPCWEGSGLQPGAAR